MKTGFKQGLLSLIVCMLFSLVMPQWAVAQTEEDNKDLEEVLPKQQKEINQKLKEFGSDIEIDAETWKKELEAVSIKKNGTITYKDKQINVVESLEALINDIEDDIDIDIEGCEQEDDIECLKEAMKDVPDKLQDALEWLKEQDVNISINKGDDDDDN